MGRIVPGLSRVFRCRRHSASVVARLSPAPPLSSQGGAGTSASQLPCVRKRKRTDPARVLVEDQRARNRGLGALAAIFPFAKSAVDADRGSLGRLEIHSGGVDELGRVADLAAEAD